MYSGNLIFELHWWGIRLLALTKRPTSYWLKQDGNLYLCHVDVQTHRWKCHGGSMTIRDPGLCNSLLCHPKYLLPSCGPEQLLQFLPSCLHSSHEEGDMMKGKGTPPPLRMTQSLHISHCHAYPISQDVVSWSQTAKNQAKNLATRALSDVQ